MFTLDIKTAKTELNLKINLVAISAITLGISAAIVAINKY